MGPRKGHVLLSNWRLAVLLISILAAMITSSIDPVNMLIVMLKLILLYGLSVLMAPGQAKTVSRRA